MTGFKDLGISADLIIKLEQHGISKPTMVQVKSIPEVLSGRDVIVQSETGSGKTISFALPIIQSLSSKGFVQALIITPTRELAKQVSREFSKFSDELIIEVVYGGVGMQDNAGKADIVIGTPGRLLDLIKRGLLNLSKVNFFVLDEADRMLDMGFIDDIKLIMSKTPRVKQVLLFSATINGKVLRFSKDILDKPVIIELESTLKRGVLKQFYYDVEQRLKMPLLVHLVKQAKGLVLVFCSTKRSTDYIGKLLKLNGIKAGVINGNMSQNSRERVISDFTNRRIRVLVATDVAARGLHVNNIELVINFDLPREADTYTHRVGRTARNGRTGSAVIILSDRDYPLMHKVKAIYGPDIKRLDTPRVPRIKFLRR